MLYFTMQIFWFLLFVFQNSGTLIVEVRSEGDPAAQVQVTAAGQVGLTNAAGELTFTLPPGEVEIQLERFGLASKTIRAAVAAGAVTRAPVEMESVATVNEEITVTATRTNVRIEDEPLRIEIVGREEIEEKALMTPGDVAMLLNETSGVRVQVTSPALGAANVRIQGLRGRYTLLLADGLPLYGGQTGSIGLLQIPPLDLGQVEVLKGVASALYGSSALGGVINLVSRRPEAEEREFLLNRTSRGGTDGVFWIGSPAPQGVGYSILGGGHFQDKVDIEKDGWADIPGYRRALLRPRFHWDNGSGRTLFMTFGAMAENREGGTMDARIPEHLRTRRFDAGAVGRLALGTKLLSIRASAMTQLHHHRFGDVVERDRHETYFGETALSGTRSRHTWVAGSALQADLYRSRDVSRFDYTYVSPGIFVQDEFAVNPQLTLSGSGRLDIHNEYGAFFNPRLSALVRLPRGLVARASAGTGVFVPTPFTEETEAIGLSRLRPLGDLEAERAVSVSADLGWTGSHVELNGSIFGSRVKNVVTLVDSALVNAPGSSRTDGSELMFRARGGPYVATLTHTFVRSDVALTPRHTASVIGMWEEESQGRAGLELFYTGRQRLEDNPYRRTSEPYWLVGAIVEKKFGPARLFVNAENLTNVRQTRHDPLLRPARDFLGRTAVDVWAPLDGRVINGGLRVAF